MTELFEPTDAFDRRLALSATGLLRDFNAAGVLSSADVHVAQRVARLVGEDDPQVLLACALAVRAVRHGSVCLDLAEVSDVAPELPWPSYDAWVAAITASPLVAEGVLRWELDLLYLDRYRQQEAALCEDLRKRTSRPAPVVDESVLSFGLARVFPDEADGEQRAVSGSAATRWTTVLTGGPGTGKTTTVARLLALLAEQAQLGGAPLRIALAAPTGKAAARLQQAVAGETGKLAQIDQDRLGTLSAVTVHRLLGSRRDNRTRFRHHRGNPLPHEVVVVDESSMVSLTMMTRLLEAIRPDARLVLVGDADQLASVEAGAVLADLVRGLEEVQDSPVARLRTSHRFGSEIGALAAAVRDGRPDDVLTSLRAGSTQVAFLETEDATPLLRSRLLGAAVDVRHHAQTGHPEQAVAAAGRHRLLCAHREGPHGVAHWNRLVEHWLSEEIGEGLYEPMYVGRPLLVTANDYGLGVSNGDSGVVVLTEEGPRAFISGARGLVDFATTRMSEVETMFATTIHKSQGSQAPEVTIVLPPPESRLLTRELLYTAITRAEQKVTLVGTEESVRAAVERRAVRASGLSRRL